MTTTTRRAPYASQRLALVLLIAMLAVFVGSYFSPGDLVGVGLVRAFSEAALVGALADWFAVTALFRRPLGLPIPHTAIVPTNQARIGRNLGAFIETNFLSHEALDKDFIDVAAVLGDWLTEDRNRRFLFSQARPLIPLLSSLAMDERISSIISRTAGDALRNIDPAPLIHHVLRVARETPGHQQVTNEILRAIRAFLGDSEGWLSNTLSQASPWFVPQFVDKRVFDAMMRKAEEVINTAMTDPHHELRHHLNAAYDKFLVRLATSEELTANFRLVRDELLESEAISQFFRDFAGRLAGVLGTQVHEQESRLVEFLDHTLREVGVLLDSDQTLREKVNRTLKQMCLSMLESNRTSIAERIAQVVHSWDASSLVERIESQIGSDLQYIRINGTLVGGLVGLALYLFKFLLE